MLCLPGISQRDLRAVWRFSAGEAMNLGSDLADTFGLDECSPIGSAGGQSGGAEAIPRSRSRAERSASRSSGRASTSVASRTSTHRKLWFILDIGLASSANAGCLE